MTEAQRIALAHHCRFGFETAHPRFCHLVQDSQVSVMLTVNSGYE